MDIGHEHPTFVTPMMILSFFPTGRKDFSYSADYRLLLVQWRRLNVGYVLFLLFLIDLLLYYYYYYYYYYVKWDEGSEQGFAFD